MFRFAAILLTMLGLALGSTSNLVSAAPLCAAPGETNCSCGQATSDACCHATIPTCCSATAGSCCQQTSSESLAAPICNGCPCCYEPVETPLAPSSASETHLPIDLLAWTSPVAVAPSAAAGSDLQYRVAPFATEVSLQVLHCRWRN
ncbi:hypothetical protein [Blastopirellula retiformator]|uniref:hypothetical protein n=1 Tax=Blastopirellula retiformator TaxID=2527970 RepID=UPI0011B3C1BB|nr:hypothetical protein [Blastopirellula retiformator]